MIHPTEIAGEEQRTRLTCDNSECGHGFEYRTSDANADEKIDHTDERVRSIAGVGAGWTRLSDRFDLCAVCTPSWTPAEDRMTSKRKERPAPNRVDYGNGVWGWSHRVTGPTKISDGGDDPGV